MYDIKWIRENLQAFDKGLSRRGMPDAERKTLIDNLLARDEARRVAILAYEQAQARRNVISKEIGEAKKAKDEARANKVMAEVAELKARIPQLEADAKRLEEELSGPSGILATIPNMPLDEVPDGADAAGNVQHHVWGKKRDYAFTPKQHFELGEALGQMDFELAAKLSGARFVVLQKGLARLERALGQFMLDLHTAEAKKNRDGIEIGGYTEVNPPILVRDEVMFGTAQLPKFNDDQFAAFPEPVLRSNFLRDLKRTRDYMLDFAEQQGIEEARKKELIDVHLTPDPGRFWLIPTAEVPLTNLVRDSIVDEDTLPRRYTACTPCFRAEAGAAGKDTRGMIRQHQFTKVELVSITTPEQSKAEHERMLACAEEVLRQLDLHYRVVTLCTGDMGFAAQKTYDIEVWLPGQNMFREISSCSVCGEFQAQRMKARYRGKDGKVKGHVHTLNGSGVAVGRALVAVLETYQQEDGSIEVPQALKPYMGGMTRIKAS